MKTKTLERHHFLTVNMSDITNSEYITNLLLLCPQNGYSSDFLSYVSCCVHIAKYFLI